MKITGVALCAVLTVSGLADRARAQLTESTATVPKGRWLVEVDAVSLAMDRHTPAKDGIEYRSITLGSWLVSTGLCDRLDLQFGLDSWQSEKTKGAGASTTYSGRGDGWLRAKWNFSGDETVGVGWALLPYLKLPWADADAGNDSVEPGIALVFGRLIGEKVQCNVNVGVDWLGDGAGGRYTPCYGSLSLTQNLNDVWAGYGEFSTWIDPDDTANWSGEFGLGVTCMVGETAWLDLALYAGLTRAAPDYTPVLRFGIQF